MNDHKIAFIICTNNKLYLDECKHYISCLNVPAGFETEIISIEGAEYMTKAYNQAMNSSSAKYKVYLHQDVFILNPNFIQDFLNIFENPNIGMIGLAGMDIARNFFPNLMWSHGTLYMNAVTRAGQESFGHIDNDYIKVQTIDGMIMITQYDLPWREDKYTGWHYYDFSQSMVFLKNNYEIVVPKQKIPWIMHDHGIVNYDNYNYWKNIFLEEHAKFLEHISHS